MFRRQEDTLTPDPKYPVDLKELGYNALASRLHRTAVLMSC